MTYISTDSISRIGCALAASAALLAGGCGTGDLGLVSFRCGASGGSDAGQGPCPHGYSCQQDLCVRDGERVPTLIANTLRATDDAFQAFEYRGGVLTCYAQDLAARESGIYGAVIGADGRIVVPNTGFYVAGAGSVSELYGVAGGCVPVGNQVVVVSALPVTYLWYERHINVVDPVANTNTVVNLPRLPEPVHPQMWSPSYYPETERLEFNGVLLGNEVWFVQPQKSDPSGGFGSRNIYRLVTDASGVPNDTASAALTFSGGDPLILPGSQLRRTDSIAADQGVWLTALFDTGDIWLTWIPRDHASPTDGWSKMIHPAPFAAAYPIATHGDELALGFRIDERHWEIWWASRTPLAGGSGFGVGMRPGPTLDVAPGMIRIGGYVDGDRLVVAGAVDHTVNGAVLHDQVGLFRTTWGGTAAFEQVGHVTKLTGVQARRTAVVRAGSTIHVLWTERTRSQRNTEFSALWESTTPAIP